MRSPVGELCRMSLNEGLFDMSCTAAFSDVLGEWSGTNGRPVARRSRGIRYSCKRPAHFHSFRASPSPTCARNDTVALQGHPYTVICYGDMVRWVWVKIPRQADFVHS